MRAPERADAEIEKYCYHTRRDPECSVVAGMPVACDFATQRRGEDHDGKEKKDAGHLEPENAAYAAEGPQKAAYAAAHGTPGVARRLPGLNCRVGCCVAGGAVLAVGTGLGAGNWSGMTHLGSGGRRVCAALQELPGHVPGDAHCDAQGAANHARSHSVYDGSSGLWTLAYRLLSKEIGSKVDRFHAATCI